MQGMHPTGRPQLCYKDVCKRDLKALKIDLSRCETLASGRSAWRQAVQQGLSQFGEALALQTEAKRQRKKVRGQGDGPVTDYVCSQCGRDCHSRIGLSKLKICNKEIAQEKFIKYLGLLIDSHLSWKYHISHISSKIKRCIGILSKIRHSVTDLVLVKVYYSLIYPFLTYGLITWGTTYQTALLPLITLQKRAVRKITFSEYNCHSSPLLRKLKILKVIDLIYLYCALFMYDYYSNRLPLILNDFFKSISKVHQYQTRVACKISYYLPKAKTNYGKFNIRFSGAKVWNSIKESLKSKSRTCFKVLLKESLISNY